MLRSVWREYEIWSLQNPPSYIQCPSKASFATTAVWTSASQLNYELPHLKLLTY